MRDPSGTGRCSTWCTAREAAKPNEIWQADHTLLDLWVVTPSGRSRRPWLTLIEDDHSRAVAGYAVNLGAPSALTTALAFRQAIWRKPWPGSARAAASPARSMSTTARTSPPRTWSR